MKRAIGCVILMMLAAPPAFAQTAEQDAAARKRQVEAMERARLDAEAERVRVMADMRAEQQRELAARVPLQLQIVVARYLGEKRVASLPYTLSFNANDRESTRLRMGATVAMPSVTPAKLPDGVMVTPVSYQDIGTNIDVGGRSTVQDGLYDVQLSIEDRSVYAGPRDPATPSAGDLPVIRTFQTKNALLLRDGQTRQFTAATDRVSGEVIRVEVTLTVVKAVIAVTRTSPANP